MMDRINGRVRKNDRILVEKEVLVSVGNYSVCGKLVVPPDTAGMVILVHNRDSNRFSVRNSRVADYLNERGIGTFLFDLLADEEARNSRNRSDIHLLTERLVSITGWVMGQDETKGVPVFYFGTGTGGAVALAAAVKLGYAIKAVIADNGFTEMVPNSLDQVTAPVLLLVGQKDTERIAANKMTYERLVCEKDIRIIQDVNTLFEDSGKILSIAEMAADWIEKYAAKQALFE